MRINMRVRMANPVFWATFIPAMMILIKAVCDLLGIQVDLSDKQDKLMQVIDAAFVVLATVGVVNDPTTAHLTDSARAMTYIEPKED